MKIFPLLPENEGAVFFSRFWKKMPALFLTVVATGLLALLGLAAACSPTVRLAAPTEPIHIKLDVKIEHEIRIKVERELDELLSPESGLF